MQGQRKVCVCRVCRFQAHRLPSLSTLLARVVAHVIVSTQFQPVRSKLSDLHFILASGRAMSNVVK